LAAEFMSSVAENISDRRLLRLLAAATLLYWIALTIVMHMPLPPSLREPEPGLPTDKTVHFVLYAGFATILFLVLEQRARFRPATRPESRAARAAAVFSFCAVHGYLEELTQPLSGRTYDLVDFAADCVGASIALTVCLLALRLLPARAT
jgi:VanZ family protein